MSAIKLILSLIHPLAIVKKFTLWGGGGGGGQPASTTQTQELPEWARGYAKDVLAKGQALTDVSQNPYQPYGAQRIADFGSLQKTAMGSVASPESWGKNVQGYMSPYMQNVVEQQQRNAREMAGAQAGALNAKAAQMGAFGGSGVALQRAAQERDLNKQLEGIQATGLQTAFQQGTQQANQALGQQMQLGALQQAQEQKGYDTAYQDFLTQKNYPYQQLSYMANLVRGTPMGMNTQSQVYQAPGNQLGQLAGLGTMAYGMSKMAEGGQVQGYDDGGSIMDKFNDPSAMLVEMDKLTDAQLQAIIQAPSTRAEGEAAKQELAQRASEDRGLSNAWEQVPYSNRQNIVRAAGGGVLAFKDEGLVDTGANLGGVSAIPYYLPGASEERDRLNALPGKWLGGIGDALSSGWDKFTEGTTIEAQRNEKRAEKERAQAARDDERALTEFDRATDDYMTARADTMKNKPTTKGISTVGGKSGPRAPGVTTSPAGVSTTPAAGGANTFEENFKTAQRLMADPEAAADRKALRELSAAQMARPAELKRQAMNDFLMQYGAGVAQAASKPGATLLGSLGGGAPAGISALMANRKAVAAAQDNNLKMQIEQRKYDIAERKNDRTAMISAAHNMQILQQQQATLGETIRHNKASEGLMGQRLAASNNAMDRAVMQTKANIWTKSVADANKNFMMLPPAEKQRYGSPEGYAKALFQEGWANAMPQLELMGKMSKDDVGG